MCMVAIVTQSACTHSLLVMKGQLFDNSKVGVIRPCIYSLVVK